MDDDTRVSAAEVRAFASHLCAAEAMGSEPDRREYERLRTKLLNACRGSGKGLDRITALSRAARASVVPGATTDPAVLTRLRQAVDNLIHYFAQSETIGAVPGADTQPRVKQE